MAGYSGTPLPQKLGIRPGATVALLGSPPDFGEVLGPLPDGVTLRRRLAAGLDVADNKVCAIDETWSGLPLVWRKERRR